MSHQKKTDILYLNCCGDGSAWLTRFLLAEENAGKGCGRVMKDDMVWFRGNLLGLKLKLSQFVPEPGSIDQY